MLLRPRRLLGTTRWSSSRVRRLWVGGLIVGKRGPRPTPTALRVLRGNPSKRPISGDEPQPASLGTLEPPVWLDETAAAIWTELAPQARELGLLTEFDRPRFAMLCGHLSRWRRHYQADPDGSDHTRSGLLRREAEIVARLSSAFGLDPASRVALRVSKKPAADSLDDFLTGTR
jgi:phage terminase small subunit